MKVLTLITKGIYKAFRFLFVIVLLLLCPVFFTTVFLEDFFSGTGNV